MKKKPFVFNYRKPKTCKVCGRTVMMFRRQKTCDECREKAGLRKPLVPKFRPC